MTKSELERLSDVGARMDVLEQICKDCRQMQDERLETTNKVLGELKSGQETLVDWHIKNMRAVYKAALAVISVILTVAGVATALVKYTK